VKFKGGSFEFRPLFVRNLSFDDIFILACIYEMRLNEEIAATLNLDACTIMKRFRKVRRTLGEQYFMTIGERDDFRVIAPRGSPHRIIFSPLGESLGRACVEFLETAVKFDAT
jgi:hypothetical protein